MLRTLAILVLTLSALPAQEAPFRAAAIFSSHMVLPAAQSVPVHGFGPRGAQVVLEPSWGGAVRGSVGADGRWRIDVVTPARGASGSMTLTCGALQQKVDDVLFGDVWLASGQSNMEWRLEQCDGASADAAAANLPELRVFTTPNAVSDRPAEDVNGEWVVCTPETAPRFTAVGFYFARELLQRGKGPIGIVDSTWGGTVCQAWTSARGLAGFPEFADALAAQQNGMSEARIRAQRELFFEALAEAAPSGTAADVTLPERWSQVGLGSFDGAVDYVRRMALPQELVGEELVLELGPIDDMDTVFWGGERVAGSERDGVWNRARRYVIPASANVAAAVELRLRVVDTGGEGGLTGSADQMKLYREAQPDMAVALAGDWRRERQVALGSLPRWPRSGGGPNRPAVLWNAMVAPLLPFPFAGAIWYQGESNRNNPDQYARLFPAMIEDWRRAMGGPLPFYFVQIAPYFYGKDDALLTPRLRDAQAAALQLPDTGMVVTLDCGDRGDIHPRNKLPVGVRLARHALAQRYGEDLDAEGPVARVALQRGATLRVAFAEQGALRLANGGDGFFIADADGTFHPA